MQPLPSNKSLNSTFLETFSLMKLNLSSKTLRHLSLMTILSVMVGTTVQQSAQAQSVSPVAQGCSKSTTRLANSPNQASTVVDIAASNPSFTTLVEALKAAELTETLSGKGPFTVFAPTNEAFAALPKGTLEKLLQPENQKTLQKILTYHVVSDNVLSKDLQSGDVATVEGGSVTVKVSNDKVKVNNANVVSADIKANNGVIHVIDRVILPPDLKL
jgi:uncharacterized surface protein with fasciclin (FAS1) repeats